MLKKLQNLLFEDEDVVEEQEIDGEDEETETVKPVKKNKKHKAAPAVEEAAPKAAAKPEMHRIYVTQAVPVQNGASKPEAARVQSSGSVFRDAAQPAARVQEEVRPEPRKAEPEAKSIGLSVDDVVGNKKPAAAGAYENQRPKTAAKKSTGKTAYEFTPVISPIFGVDEKDMDAVQNTAKKITKVNSEHKSEVPDIISPMYGVSQDAVPSMVQKTVERSNEMEKMSFNSTKAAAEQSVPEFSLDDILKVRDEQFAEEVKQNTAEGNLGSIDDALRQAEDDSAKPEEDIDQTVVINSRNLSLFDDDDKKAGSK